MTTPIPNRHNSINDDPNYKSVSVGSYVAQRLVEAGGKDFFTVPGDFILTLLDNFIDNRNLIMTNCCNELNAGYAADGYCRATNKLGILVVTYMVGSLSCINAVAGAYSDDLPLLVISGGPNNLDERAGHIIHHTIGEQDFYQASKCFEPVVAKVFVVKQLHEVALKVDEAIRLTLSSRKPVYLEIACNLIGLKIPAPSPRDLAILTNPAGADDATTLTKAVDDILNSINNSSKISLVAGVKLRVTEATEDFKQLGELLGCGVAVMPDAKSLFPEDHPLYMGCYWGSVSSSKCAEIVESSDLYIYVGPIFNDYTTTGWSALINGNKLIEIGRNYVKVGNRFYGDVNLRSVLQRLIAAGNLPKRDASIVSFKHYHSESPILPVALSSKPLLLSEIQGLIQGMLTPSTNLVVETGDSWFIGQQFKLPTGAKYHVQMQYGSIGWSLGCTLGVGLGVGETRKVITLIGDGSFQMTAQELSSIIRRKANVIIFLLNNSGYTIEVQIHDNTYNDIQNWNYYKLVDVFNFGSGTETITNGDAANVSATVGSKRRKKDIAAVESNVVVDESGNTSGCLALKVKTSEELADAIKQSDKHTGLSFIECILDRFDCTSTLLEWGSRVASSNGRY